LLTGRLDISTVLFPVAITGESSKPRAGGSACATKHYR
jgi:hypothetical protein